MSIPRFNFVVIRRALHFFFISFGFIFGIGVITMGLNNTGKQTTILAARGFWNSILLVFYLSGGYMVFIASFHYHAEVFRIMTVILIHYASFHRVKCEKQDSVYIRRFICPETVHMESKFTPICTFMTPIRVQITPARSMPRFLAQGAYNMALVHLCRYRPAVVTSVHRRP